jgi:L-2-hydroxycarboxylate dehydrogenase (NAD+)
LLYSIQHLSSFAEKVFLACGFSDEDARHSSLFLTKADLRGIDSHGVARLSGYVRLIREDRLNPKPNLKWESRFPTLWHLDADRAIGFVSAREGMLRCISAAQSYGVGMVAIKNSNHFGIAGQYALLAAEAGLIGMAFTNASPLVAPTHSIDRLLGTNPISVAIPSQSSRPFVLDMATTTAANGKLEILQRKSQKAPEGWLQKSDGSSSTDPGELRAGGALRPLGSSPDMGSHKGYGLGALVDILSGVVSGANFGPWVPPFVSFLPVAEQGVGQGIGHFLVAFRPDGFMPQNEFLERMEIWMKAFRTSESLEGHRVLVPGDPEWEMEDQRSLAGVPLLAPVVEDLNRLASELQLPLFSSDHS